MEDIEKNIMKIDKKLMDIKNEQEKSWMDFKDAKKIYLQNMNLIETVKIIEVNEDILQNDILRLETKYLKKMKKLSIAELELKEAKIMHLKNLREYMKDMINLKINS